MTSCRTETATVRWTEKAGPFHCCCSQWLCFFVDTL